MHAGLRDNSALFRHDVAFCMGQRQDPMAVQVLQRILHDPAEHPMWVKAGGCNWADLASTHCVQGGLAHARCLGHD